MKKLVIDCETGESQEIDLTADELIKWQEDKLKAEEEAQAKAEAAAAKAALLEKLGITEEEAKLLLS